MTNREALGWQENINWEWRLGEGCFERDFHISCGFPFSQCCSGRHVAQENCRPWRIPPDANKLQPEPSHLCICEQSQHISSLGSIQAALHSNAVLFLLPYSVHHPFFCVSLVLIATRELFSEAIFCCCEGWWILCWGENKTWSGSFLIQVAVLCCLQSGWRQCTWVSQCKWCLMLWKKNSLYKHLSDLMKFSTCTHDKLIFKIPIKGLRNLWRLPFSATVLEEYIFQIFQAKILVCLIWWVFFLFTNWKQF